MTAAQDPRTPVSAQTVAVFRSRFPVGDAIAMLTGLVGIESCAPCKRRQQILNQWGDDLAGALRFPQR